MACDSKYLIAIGIKKSTAEYLAENMKNVLETLREKPMSLISYMTTEEIYAARANDAKETYASQLFSLLLPYEFRPLSVMRIYDSLEKDFLTEINQCLSRAYGEELEDNPDGLCDMLCTLAKEHPYRLCGFDSFEKVDGFALDQGIDSLSDDRLKAAILDVLRNCTTFADPRFSDLNGGTCVEEGKLYDYTALLLKMEDMDYSLFKSALVKLFMNGEIHISHIGPSEYIFPKHTANIEFGIAKIINRKFGAKQPELKNLSRLIEKAEAELGILLSDEQSDAVRMALSYPISVITGGPGTGKTAVQKVLIETFEWATKCMPVRLIAPTGQAAKRMTESTGYPATTIHKALRLTAGDYEVSEDLSIDEGLIIADEASMIDEDLFYALLSSISDESRIVVVGDVNQLPAIGTGAVLRELINSDKVPVTRLTKVFRQADDSPVAYNAARIKAGETILIENDRFQFKTPSLDNQGETLADLICETYAACVKESGIDNVICLTAFRRYTDTGVDALNIRLRNLVRTDITKDTPMIRIKDKIFYEGDKIVYNKNRNGLVNGDLGTILRVKGHKAAECIFGEMQVTLLGSDFENLDLAYAQTVHKSQGAEFKTVIMVTDERHKKMLNKELVYTAVTRAKEKLICCTDYKATFLGACRNPAQVRNSLLGRIIDAS